MRALTQSTQICELMDYSAYSLDLEPDDFCLFPHVQIKLRAKRFSSPEEVVDAFKNHILGLW